MSQHCSDPSRENDPTALPDLEVFYWSADDIAGFGEDAPDGPGWFWWVCLPGCLPDSEATGPFESEGEALANAREVCGPW